MKCPFCGEELENGNSWSYYCPNVLCEHSDFCGTPEIWQSVIDGKAEKDALKVVRNDIEAIIHEWNNPNKGVGASARVMCALACHAKDTIESLTKPGE